MDHKGTIRRLGISYPPLRRNVVLTDSVLYVPGLYSLLEALSNRLIYGLELGNNKGGMACYAFQEISE